MNHLALLIGSYLAIASQQDPTALNASLSEWESYKAQYGKQYESPAVETMRMANFFHNKRRIDEFNRSPEAQNFTLELNHLADMSEHEIMPRKGPRKLNQVRPRNSPEAVKFINDILSHDLTKIPDELDWRKTPGVVSKVKDQGECLASYAFATTGLLEGQQKLKLNQSELVELSAQYLVDCGGGCDSYGTEAAFSLIDVRFDGIDDEKSYPYEGKLGRCRHNKNSGRKITDYAFLAHGDEENLKMTVAKYGPVAVAIAAGPNFQLYKRGVFYEEHCKVTSDFLNQAVLIVGYGTDPKGGDYWLAKNSYGEKWGENGYIRLARNRNNNCGVATDAIVAIM